MIREKRIIAYNVGRQYIIKEQDLNTYLVVWDTKDKDILNMLGLNDRTITLTADDEYLQIMLEKKIDNYLKKIDEEKKKQEQIDYYKNQY